MCLSKSASALSQKELFLGTREVFRPLSNPQQEKLTYLVMKEEYSAGNVNGCYRNPCFEQFGELLGKHRPTEIVPLSFFALMSLKKLQLFQLFHALGNHPQL